MVPSAEWTVVVCLSFPCLRLPGQELSGDKALPLLAEGLPALHLHPSPPASGDEISCFFYFLWPLEEGQSLLL